MSSESDPTAATKTTCSKLGALCCNPFCSTVGKCSNYYILDCNCIAIYRQNVIIITKRVTIFLIYVALL